MARVLRPGGRISLIDTDWSTFRLHVDDTELATLVRQAMRTERGRPSNVGSRLSDLLRSAGFEQLTETRVTQTWFEWNPDQSPAPDGCFSMRSLVDDLVADGRIDPSRDGTVRLYYSRRGPKPSLLDVDHDVRCRRRKARSPALAA